MSRIEKILVANRGEIACRVMRTARDLGYRTVAVYSEADRDALHVLSADESVCIGAAPVGESYLLAENVLAAAKATGADAIHPGYGFLSENSEFSHSCAEAGITFIGPPAGAIELMGSKRLSKIAMLEAGVPCIPGYQGEAQDDDTLIGKAQEIGFPLMVKASAGGGGRGMRLVNSAEELPEMLKTARSEALNAFGSDELILERAVLEPRHIEIQVFADDHGNVVYLGERDCSIQRRHQKVVEEAPSPFVDEALRQRMGEAAVNAARACDYRGAGTVEFLADKDGNFYFLEMNTRLQVEHPVTEMITGQDLVAWQIAVASGQPLPLSQDQITLQGHAVEVRLYAEDPRRQFLPQTGVVRAWFYPERDGIRADHGIAQGQEVTAFYDPMIAKLIAYGSDRDEACRKLASALQDTHLLGLNNNRLFLERIVRHPGFLAGEATTAFLEESFGDDESMRDQAPSFADQALAALIFYVESSSQEQTWRATSAASYHFKLSCEDRLSKVQLVEDGDGFLFSDGEQQLRIGLLSRDSQSAEVIVDNVRQRVSVCCENDRLWLDAGRGHYCFDNVTQAPAAAAAGAGSGEIKAPMDGAIVDVSVAEGQTVEAGQTLAVLEAMKMEHPLKAGIAGIVSAVNVSVGDQVKSKQVLVVVSDE